MKLDWRPVAIGDGPPISTSLTKGEANTLRRLAKDKVVLEVGAAYGYSTIILALTAKWVDSVDPHHALDSLNAYWGNLQTYGIDNVTVHVKLNRQALPFFEELWDMVFIDGDHADSEVRFDVEYAKKLVKPGGVVVVHDYGEDTCPAVAPVCDQLLPEGSIAVDTLWVWTRPEEVEPER